MKMKAVIRMLAIIIVTASVIGETGAYMDMLKYEVGNDEPQIISVDGEIVEIDELPGEVQWDEFYGEDYQPVRVDYVLYNPANTMLYLNGSIASYDAETQYGYCSVLTKNSDDLLISHYSHCDVLPADCSAEYSEYIRK